MTTNNSNDLQAWKFLLPTETQAELTALIESREAMRDALRDFVNLYPGHDECGNCNVCRGRAALALADSQGTTADMNEACEAIYFDGDDPSEPGHPDNPRSEY